MLTNILKRAGTDAFKYFPVRLVPALTSLITVPVFTRLIAREDYGNFSLISSAVSLAAVFATQWVNNSIIRFYWPYEKEKRSDNYVSTAIWATLGSLVTISLIVGALVLAFSGQMSDGLRRLVPIGLASLAANYLVTATLQLLRAANRSTRYAILSITNTLVGTALSVGFVVLGKTGAFGILAGVALGNVVMIPVGLWMASQQGSLAPRHVSRDILREFARYGMPFIPAAISSWALVLADRYVLGALRGAAEVGLYSTAYTLGDKIMNLIVMPLMITMGPIMVETFEKNGQELAQKVQTQFTRYYAMVTFPVIAGMTVIAHDFFEVFVGPVYRVAYPVLPIVMVGVMLYGAVQIAANGVAFHKRSTIIMTNTMAAAAVNVAANLLLIPHFGYMVAAFNTVLAYTVLLALTWIRSKPYMAWQLPWADLARIVGASAVMAGVLLGAFTWFESSIWMLGIQVLTGITVYFLALRGMQGLRPDELGFIGEMRLAVMRKLRLGKRG